MLRHIQTRIVQKRSGDALSEISLSAEQSGVAFRTKAAHIFAHHFAGCAEVFWRALGNLERGRRDVKNRSVRSAGCFLAVPAMAIEHHDRVGGDFVANRSARASAGKFCRHDQLLTITSADQLLATFVKAFLLQTE